MNHPGVALILATGGNAHGPCRLLVRQAGPRRRRRQRARLHRAHREAQARRQRRRAVEGVRQRHGLRLRAGRHPRRRRSTTPRMAEFAQPARPPGDPRREADARGVHLRRRRRTARTAARRSSTPPSSASPRCGSPSRRASRCPTTRRSSSPRSAGSARSEPLTREKLAPVLAVLRAKDADEGIALSAQMVEFDGLGHSRRDPQRGHRGRRGVRQRASRPCGSSRTRPRSLGGIGDIYNAFIPSLTLGCGSYGHNSVSNNVSAVNLLNIKRIGRRNNNLQWFKVPAKTYFEPNAIRYLADMPDVRARDDRHRRHHDPLGLRRPIIDVLGRRDERVALQIIDDVAARADRAGGPGGRRAVREFGPDTIIALGGGSPMDAAKVMWLLYEHPEVEFADMQEKFFDVRKRAFTFPELGEQGAARVHPDDLGHGLGDDAVRGDHRPDRRQEVPARRLRAHPVGGDHRPGARVADARLPRRGLAGSTRSPTPPRRTCRSTRTTSPTVCACTPSS